MDPLRIIPFDEFYDFNKEKKGEGDWKSLGKHGEIDKEHLLYSTFAAFGTDAPTKELQITDQWAHFTHIKDSRLRFYAVTNNQHHH